MCMLLGFGLTAWLGFKGLLLALLLVFIYEGFEDYYKAKKRRIERFK